MSFDPANQLLVYPTDIVNYVRKGVEQPLQHNFKQETFRNTNKSINLQEEISEPLCWA